MPLYYSAMLQIKTKEYKRLRLTLVTVLPWKRTCTTSQRSCSRSAVFGSAEASAAGPPGAAAVLAAEGAPEESAVAAGMAAVRGGTPVTGGSQELADAPPFPFCNLRTAQL